MKPILLLLAALTFVLPARGEAQEVNSITRVSVHGTSVDVQGTQKPNFTTFSMSDPPRLVIDFSEAAFVDVPEEIAVNNGVVSVIKTASYGSDSSSIARVVIGLVKDFDTDIKTHQSQLTVAVLGATPTVEVAAAKAVPVEAHPPSPPGQTAQEAAKKAEEQARVEAEKLSKKQALEAEAARVRAESEKRAEEERAKAEQQRALAQAEELKKQQEREAEVAHQKAEREEQLREKKAKEDAEKARAEAEELKKKEEREAEVARQNAEREHERLEKKAKEGEQRALAQARDLRKKQEREAEEARRLAEREQRAQEKKAKDEEQKARAQAEALAKKELAQQELAQKQAEAESRAEQKKIKAAEQRARLEADRLAKEEARQQSLARRKAEDEQKAQQMELKKAQARARAEAARLKREEKRAAERAGVLTMVGFKPEAAGARVFVRTTRPVHYSVVKREKSIVLQLENTRLGSKNNARPLDTSFFHTAVAGVHPGSGPAHSVEIEIALRELVPYQANQQGNEVSLDFQGMEGR